MNVRYAFYESVLGYIKIGCLSGAVCEISFADTVGDVGKRSDLSDAADLQIREYLNGCRKVFDFPVTLCGTDFQKRVWAALCDIPYGETRSYRDIAEKIGNAKAVRAVGGAIGKNPVSIAVPCHRVIGADGTLIGYAGGLWRKQLLLGVERGKSTAARSEI